MGKKYTGLSLEDHKKVARALREVRRNWMIVCRLVFKGYGPSSKAGKACDGTMNGLKIPGNVRSFLDDKSFDEHKVEDIYYSIGAEDTVEVMAASIDE